MAPVIRVGAKAVILQDERVLLIRYKNGDSEHYNFPGGGIQRGESIRKGLRREVLEETNLDVKVDSLLLVGEYDPKKHKRKFGRIHKLTLYFLCTIRESTKPDLTDARNDSEPDLLIARNERDPNLPDKPDRDQVGVEWFPIKALPDSLLPLYHDLIVAAVDDGSPRKLFTTRK
jgi:ADP-ribose pyrophosphatase YjhB (NUDIX family)